jgi:serine-type D-Ala-D-Ala carboxypeptidase/endopeptidase (penicillin-binding protein 4)
MNSLTGKIAFLIATLILLVPTGELSGRQPAASGSTLDQRVQSLFNDPVAARSNASLMVAEVESGRVVAARNPHRPVSPASNMKLFTSAAGIELLGADFQFRTIVAIKGTVDPIGTLHGDVLITGRGDPTIGGRFHDGDAARVIRRWAADLRKAGVKTVGGISSSSTATSTTSGSTPPGPKISW